ncbi:histidine kinase [Streptomyces sp. ODS28]|uniref:sensor histidine kinase n=1 Tax=Streptomyces sp. ODS28 TaxID=3136688 RepID=UPI0031E88FF4
MAGGLTRERALAAYPVEEDDEEHEPEAGGGLAGSARDLSARLAPILGPVALAVADALLVNGTVPGPELAVSLIAAGALFLRRRYPLGVLLVTLPGMYIGYIWFAPMIALYTVTCRRPSRQILVWCALLVAAMHFLPYPIEDLYAQYGTQPARDTLLDAVDSALTTAAPLALGLLVRARRELTARLEELTRSRTREDRLLAGQVLATERARLAREMHDVVAHQVSLISLQAGALRVSGADENAREAGGTIRSLAVRTLDELRHMVGVLRAAGGDLEELTPQPRLSDLPRLIEDSALDAELDLPDPPEDPGARKDGQEGREDPGGPPYPEAVERAAYRIVQEALTNVRKHAPGARVLVRVRPRSTDSAPALRVEVSNSRADRTAVPLGLPSGGHGLIGLRERVQLLGGTFESGPTADHGYRVSASLPICPRAL